MIVKVKNLSGDYDFFEGDSVMQARNKMSTKELFSICNPETIYIIKDSDNVPEKGYLSLHMYKKRKPVQWVITDSRCYLMNEDGRTIEKLN